MSDVFISYASADREPAGVLAKALTDLGWAVWWDRNILTGQSYDQVIERELSSAKTVVVLWSKESVASEWVKNEAAAGSERGVLLPAIIEAVTPPLEFRRKQTADLVGWDGDVSHSGFQALRAGIANALNPSPSGPARAGSAGGGERRSWRPVGIAVGVGLVILGAFAAGRWIGPTSAPPLYAPTLSDPVVAPATRPATGAGETGAPAASELGPAPASANLLSTENGGHLLIATSDAWSVSIDGKDTHGYVRAGEEAVFAFKDERAATFNRFGMLIPAAGRNPKEFDLLAGDESPTGAFRTIGTFHPQNAKLFQLNGWQDFTFPPVTARYLKVRLQSSFEESVWIELTEFRLLSPKSGP